MRMRTRQKACGMSEYASSHQCCFREYVLGLQCCLPHALLCGIGGSCMLGNLGFHTPPRFASSRTANWDYPAFLMLHGVHPANHDAAGQ
jgi:hypothetical protein